MFKWELNRFQDSDILHRAKDFHTTTSTLRKLFLVHGTADDNVHMQHSMVLAKELVKEGVLFKQQVPKTFENLETLIFRH